MSLGNEIHIIYSDCGSRLRHFLRTCFIHAVSPLTPVCLSVLALIASCSQLHSVRFRAYLMWADWESLFSLRKGFPPPSMYQFRVRDSFLSIIPWMSILSYFLEVPDTNESHLLKP